MRSTRRAAWCAVLAVGLASGLAGCKRTQLADVPTLGSKTCSVRVGDARSNVLLRCGGPCGGGEVAPDLRCDIYVSSEICYRGGQVATVGRLPPFNGRFAWCNWPEDPPEPEATPRSDPAQDSGTTATSDVGEAGDALPAPHDAE